VKFDEHGKCPYTYKGTQWVGYEDENSLQIKMDWIKSKGYAGAMTWAIDMDDFRGKCGKKNALTEIMYDSMKDYTVPTPSVNTTPRPEWARPPSTPSSNDDLPVVKPTTRKPTEATKPTQVIQDEKPTTTPKPLSNTTSKKKRKKKTRTTTTTTTTTSEPEVMPEEEEEEPEMSVEAEDEFHEPVNTLEFPNCAAEGVDENRFFPSPEDCTQFYRCTHGTRANFTCEAGTAFNIEKQVCAWPTDEQKDRCKLGYLKLDDEMTTTVAADDTTLEIEVQDRTDKTLNEVET
jgi:chitinase